MGLVRHADIQRTGPTLKNYGANAYELAKFEQNEPESVRLSPALLAYLAERNERITVQRPA